MITSLSSQVAAQAGQTLRGSVMTTQHFESIDPSTGALIAAHASLSPEELERLLEQAHVQAQRSAGMPVEARCESLQRVADRLEAEREHLAELMTLEMGKLTREALAEVDKCAWVCRYYAQQAPDMLADQLIPTDARRSLVAKQPLGVILAVMPWNFPLWQVFRAAAPAIAAGNVLLLKHASNVIGCGNAIAAVFDSAGVPPGVFTHLPVPSGHIAGIIADRRVQAVTLTGSDAAGRAVASAAGQALKKSVLELGGSDAFVVLEDADLDLTVEKAVTSRFLNCGQSCIAAKRFIVLDAVADAFSERFSERIRTLCLGDPRDPATDVGPMARSDLREELQAQVSEAVAHGARVLAGGGPGPGPGFHYQPTLLTDVRPGMRAYAEELFGPVAALYRVPDEAAALRLANDVAFGLGGSVWTRDRARGEAFARQLACGCAFVNELVKSDPRLPFGGIRESGYGRELSVLGLHEFVNHKSIWVD